MQSIQTIDSKFYRELGNQLREIRQNRNMTLMEVARATGFSRTLIDHWELGFNKIKSSQFEKLCEALQVSSNLKIEVKIGFLED